ncbi:MULTISPECIES: methyl-accepting chemotaxis protein [Planktothricoides]|uniref:Methyl-accepting chemotaxis protein n=1 Tax=Planktothricoides raciborskii GIHE-MW2 TaxID=2792601 RepID=A0AAU8JH03_9CYAN|nr:methyl-accepting chemotaxis protein [Planktothricoides sp. SR001]
MNTSDRNYNSQNIQDSRISQNNQKNFLSRLKLRTQMLIGYAIPVVVFMGSASIVYTNTNEVFDAFNRVETVQKSIIETNKVALSGSNMVANSRAFLLSEKEDFIKLYNQNWQDFQQASKILERDHIVTDIQQKQRFEEMKRIGQEYDRYANQIFNLVKTGNSQAAMDLFNSGIGTKALADFLKLTNEFTETETQKLSQENIAAKKTLQLAVNLLIFGSGISALTALVIAWLISSVVSNKISQSASSIDNSAGEINRAVRQQETITNSQVISINQTTTSMDELGASAKQATQQADMSALGAQHLLNLAETGNQLVATTLAEMAETKGKVQGIAEQTLRLSDRTNQIAIISQLVSDLANQTNMLALNAAVEAVRAGEAGKGFSVVALEIRKLADQSKKSAEKINNLVRDIQESSSTTVTVTQHGIQSVENTEKLAQETANSFNLMAEKIKEIVMSSQQISLNAKQQASAIQQVVIAMNNLSQNAQDSNDGMNQIKIGIQKLNHAAAELNDIVQPD